MKAHESSDNSSRGMKKIYHAALMSIFGAWIGYLMSGALYGFSHIPVNLGSASIIWAQWMGTVIPALVISLIVLIRGKSDTAWITFVVLIAGSVYLMRPLDSETQSPAQESSVQTNKSSLNVNELPQSKKQLTVSGQVQSSQGVLEEDIDSNFIAGIEGYLLKDKQSQYERVMKSVGATPTKDAMVAGSQIVTVGDYKLVITEIANQFAGPDSTKTKIAWWIQGQELKLVQCVDTTGTPIALRTGKCAHQISETFNFPDWPLD